LRVKYEYECLRYQQDPSSAKTALAEANGCGPKLFGDIGLRSFYTGVGHFAKLLFAMLHFDK